MDKMRNVWTVIVVLVFLLGTTAFILFQKAGRPLPMPASSPGEVVAPMEQKPVPVSAMTPRSAPLHQPSPVVPPAPVTTVPERLRAVYGKNGESFALRLEAVHTLGQDLSFAEKEALYALLYRKAGDDSLTPDQLNAFKNDIVNVLKNQPNTQIELIHHLMRQFADETQDLVWRDYCIQHLGTLYSATAEENRAELQDVLWNATGLKQGATAGTALIALADNRAVSGLPETDLRDRALVIAQDASYGEGARMTALQICAKLDDRRALSLARELVDGGSSVSLEVSAIAVLGALGDQSDRARVEALAASGDVRLVTAARAAVKKLNRMP